ncbi:MAG: cytochrome c3 family protein [Acidobacteriota bacterium]
MTFPKLVRREHGTTRHQDTLSSVWLVLTFAVITVNQAFAVPDGSAECMACHEDASLKDAANRSLFVSQAAFDKSIHGRMGVSCVSCHVDLEGFTDFPHADRLARVDCSTCHSDARQKFETSIHGTAKVEGKGEPVTCVACHGYHDVLEKSDVRSKSHPMQQANTCGSCHFTQVRTKKGGDFVRGYLDSVHGQAISKSGLSTSATCATCHGAHAVRRSAEPGSPMSRDKVPNTCGQCHSGILLDYIEGVHGKDFEGGIQDVPVCTDCHGEHGIRSPQDKLSTVHPSHVAQTCARCHDNQELIERYKLPEARLRTFEGTFHGIALSYGETRVANCASCHGFHNIRPSADPKSPIHPTNLPATCGHCHPGAGEKLSAVKIHILDPRAANYAGFIVGRFYYYLIVIMMSSFVLYILADLRARLAEKKKP